MNIIRISFALLIIFSIHDMPAQTDSSHQGKWSASFLGGVFMPFDKDEYSRSANTGFDISYNYSPAIAVYLDFSYNFLRVPDNHYYRPSSGLLEATMGARFYLDPTIDYTFVELGIGYYQKFTHERGLGYDYRNNTDEFGLNGGMGTDIKITKGISIPIKAKLHFINILVAGDKLIYWGIYSGVKYSF